MSLGDWEYRSALAGGQDNTSLVYLNDATILQNLRSRHQDYSGPLGHGSECYH